MPTFLYFPKGRTSKFSHFLTRLYLCQEKEEERIKMNKYEEMQVILYSRFLEILNNGTNYCCIKLFIYEKSIILLC